MSRRAPYSLANTTRKSPNCQHSLSSRSRFGVTVEVIRFRSGSTGIPVRNFKGILLIMAMGSLLSIDSFASLCFVRADLSRLSNSAQPKTGPNGQTYWTVVFSIEIHFGLTEFKARMKWNEDVSIRNGLPDASY